MRVKVRSSRLSNGRSNFGSLFLFSVFAALLIPIISYIPSEVLAQTGQQYLVCQYYCQQASISVEYPADYVKEGQGTAWFVEFRPTSVSNAAVTIFVDYASISSSLDEYFSNYVNGLRNSTSLQSIQILGTPTSTNLGAQDAQEVTYTYVGSDGTSMKAEDIMTVDGKGRVYTLSFLADSNDFDNALGIIQHVQNSFKFLS